MNVIIGLALVFGVVLSGFRVVQEYERLVVFRLGRLLGVQGPGICFLVPFLDRAVRVDLRTLNFELPVQEVVTRDNVTIKVTAVVYYRFVAPDLAVTRVADGHLATVQLAQTTLRNVLGQSALDEILASRDALNDRLQRILDELTEPWGIKVTVVALKDLELPVAMQRAMARQAEAEREKRAKVLHAEGERLAAETLADAATILAREPAAIQLRYLQTLADVATEKNSTILFPVPIALFEGLLRRGGEGGG